MATRKTTSPPRRPQFMLTVHTLDNDAFTADRTGALARILIEVATVHLPTGQDHGTVRDATGHAVAAWAIA